MAGGDGVSYAAECYWPGVQADDLRDLDGRITAAAAGQATPAGQAAIVRYLGSMLIVDDEVVLCLFEGRAEAVRDVLERSGTPYERILQTSGAPWSSDAEARNRQGA